MECAIGIAIIIVLTVWVSIILPTLSSSASTGSIIVVTRRATVLVIITARSCGGLTSTVALIVINRHFSCGMVHERCELGEFVEKRDFLSDNVGNQSSGSYWIEARL